MLKCHLQFHSHVPINACLLTQNHDRRLQVTAELYRERLQHQATIARLERERSEYLETITRLERERREYLEIIKKEREQTQSDWCCIDIQLICSCSMITCMQPVMWQCMYLQLLCVHGNRVVHNCNYMCTIIFLKPFHVHWFFKSNPHIIFFANWNQYSCYILISIIVQCHNITP